MGGLSKYQGSKGANQYEQYGIVRFELPFDGWCLKCDRHICKGHRFNAKKDKIGKYFTTTLYSFATKCPSVDCDQKFLIKTDPQNRTYDFAEGLRKMVQDFTPGADDSIIEVTSEETKILIENDPMFKLQHDKAGKLKADAAKNTLQRLINVQNDQFKNDFDSNSLLRQRNRQKKHRNNQLLQEGNKIGLSIPLVEPSDEDIVGAQRANFRPLKPTTFQVSERLKLTELIGGSIFQKPHSKSTSGSISSGIKRRQSFIEGSDAKRSRTSQEAMKKQAAMKINVAGFKISESNSTVTSQNIPIQQHKVSRRQGEDRTVCQVDNVNNRSSICETNSVEPGNLPKGIGLADMLGRYAGSSDDEISS